MYSSFPLWVTEHLTAQIVISLIPGMGGGIVITLHALCDFSGWVSIILYKDIKFHPTWMMELAIIIIGKVLTPRHFILTT